MTRDEWLATAVDFYYQEVNRISNARAVPTINDINDLDVLKQFLAIEHQPIVSKVNLELFGDKYVKALSEAMTPTGVITEEYINGLERLRVRLGLSEQDARQLLNVASRSRMIPIIKDLVNIWKSDTDATYRRDQEKKAVEKGKMAKRDKSGKLVVMYHHHNHHHHDNYYYYYRHRHHYHHRRHYYNHYSL